MQAPANPDLEIWCKIFRRLIYVDLGNCKCAEPGGGGYIEDSPSPTNSSGPATQQVSRANIYSAAREPGGRPARPEGPLSQSNIHSVAREPREDLQDLKALEPVKYSFSSQGTGGKTHKT